MRRAKLHVFGLCTAAIGLATAALPAQAQQTIRCASEGRQHRYCPITTDNRVELVRQRSWAACRQGESWGFDANGVWVNHGCVADFRVGAPGVQAGDGPLGSLRRSIPGGPPSRWALNTYVAFDDTEHAPVKFSVAADGTVTGRIGDRSFTGRITDTWLQTDRHTFKLQISGTGFLATNERNPKHQVQFNMEAGTN